MEASPAVRAVLQRIAKVACRVGDVEEAAILLCESAGAGSLVRVAGHGSRGAPTVAVWRADTGAVGRALSDRTATAESSDEGGRRAAAPLLVDGKPRGVLAVSAAAPARGFDGDQLEMLTELAEIGAASLDEVETRERAAAAVSAGAEVLARAVDMRDDYTGRHSSQVSELARRVGARLGMSGDEVELLECAARLHDIGKLGVPDAILQKPGPLDEYEWAVMRRHPDWGAEMVGRVPGLEPAAALVRAHHERWDGCGYPDGLAGEGIPLASRVIGACDAFEAMVSDRPYRHRMSVDQALAELAAGAGTQFDPEVVEAVGRERGVRRRAAGSRLA
jgi:hypothetical protein